MLPAQRSDCCISIHALREEGDNVTHTSALWTSYFYPRPPRGGRLSLWTVDKGSYRISIHALREEGDIQCLQSGSQTKLISIHALREEGDPVAVSL